MESHRLEVEEETPSVRYEDSLAWSETSNGMIKSMDAAGVVLLLLLDSIMLPQEHWCWVSYAVASLICHT